MLSDAEFETILQDGTKRIVGDIVWGNDEDHLPAQEFRMGVVSEADWPLTMVGTWQPMRETLSLVLVHGNAGRIVGLCLGFAPHRNPNRELMGDPHKHRWTAEFADREAYEPDDITAPWSSPIEVWQQFCTEVRILHEGSMFPPPDKRELAL